MKTEEIEVLIQKYISAASAQEKAIVEEWYENLQGSDADLNPAQLQLIKSELKSKIIADTQPPTVLLWRKIMWAAAALVVGLLGTLFYVNNEEVKKPSLVVNSYSNDIRPAANKAVLTLANGEQIILNNDVTGTLAHQSEIKISKTDAGQLSYAKEQTTVHTAPATELINTLTTPRGGKYVVTLSDGTKVWMNAASSLRYPAAFLGEERRVELVGEAYFEVAKNTKMPFKVVSGLQTIEVLGTHFNINAYKEDPTLQSTLIEGSISIRSGKSAALLKPGQQANITAKNPFAIKVISGVNVDEVTAWKDGYFQFESADIETILGQFSRWYDMDISYQSEIPTGHYHGKVSRNLGIKQALKILNLSGINFKIEGKKIIVK